MNNRDYNNNVMNDGHYESWNNKLGKNFTDNNGLHSDMMRQKNIETGGGYQATVSGMYGEFTIAAVFKSLPDEYAVLNDILIQTGIQYRKYGLNELKMYGETPWELCARVDKNKYKVVNKNKAMTALMSGQRVFYEAVKKSSQLDHVIVSPYGIFVIETKNHKGWVFGDIHSKVWTQVLNGENGSRAYGGHAHYTFYNPVAQNEQHMVYLSQYLRMPRQYMVGMIVFTNPEAYLGNVNCNCCFTLDMLANAIFSYRNQLWSIQQRDKIIKMIEKLNSSSYSLSREHVTYVKDMQHRMEINKILALGKR